MRAVLDTNHFREVAEGSAGATVIERRATRERTEITLSIITVQEATGGWLGLINGIRAGRDQIHAYESFQRTITALQRFMILPFDEAAADHFHALQSERPRTGTMDLKIAAICLAHDATLLTRNLADFADIPGLRVEDWLE